jgi:hypothetical protein
MFVMTLSYKQILRRSVNDGMMGSKYNPVEGG